MTEALKEQARDLDADLAICEAATPGPWMDLNDAVRFISAAREGWTYAIRRAQEAEARVDKLENELRMMQDAGRCWD